MTRTIETARRADGWRYVSATDTKPAMFIAPDGTRYVQVTGRERADLLYEHGEGREPTRLRCYERSAALKRELAKAKKARRAELAREEEDTQLDLI